MAKKVTALIKLQVPAGKATPAPPIGPALGQHGVNIPGFCKEFNDRTGKQAGLIIPVVITVYQDRSFTFITKTPPAAVLIKKAYIGNNCYIKNSIILNYVYIGDNTHIENCIVESGGTILANSYYKGEDGPKVVIEKSDRYVF